MSVELDLTRDARGVVIDVRLHWRCQGCHVESVPRSVEFDGPAPLGWSWGDGSGTCWHLCPDCRLDAGFDSGVRHAETQEAA